LKLGIILILNGYIMNGAATTKFICIVICQEGAENFLRHTLLNRFYSILLYLLKVLSVIDEDLNLAFENHVELVSIVILVEHEVTCGDHLIAEFAAHIHHVIRLNLICPEKLDLSYYGHQNVQVFFRPLLWILLENLDHHLYSHRF
jgi:hypothetical protein